MITPAGVVQEFELKGSEGADRHRGRPRRRIWVVANGKASELPARESDRHREGLRIGEIHAEPNIVLGPDGIFWVASNNKVAKFSPANFKGTIAEVPLDR